MESITKNRKSIQTIAKMLQRAFGEGISTDKISINELTEGFFNVAYEITLPDRNMILKIAPPKTAKIMSYEHNIMKAEVDALRLVRQKTTVPVPEVLYYDNSFSICDSDYFLMEKVEGSSFLKLKNNGQIPYEKQNEVYYNIGRFNFDINQLEGESFGYLGQPHKQGVDWSKIFLAMIEDVLRDGENIGIALCTGYDEVRKLIEKASFSLSEVSKPAFVHWDLWDGNVFVKDGIITGIIDFERAIWADPLMEFYFRGHTNIKAFFDGYGKNLREESPVRALLYDVYLFCIMTIETKYRMYPDDWMLNFSTKQLATAIEKLKLLI